MMIIIRLNTYKEYKYSIDTEKKIHKEGKIDFSIFFLFEKYFNTFTYFINKDSEAKSLVAINVPLYSILLIQYFCEHYLIA